MKEKINMDGCIVTRCYPCVSLGMFDFLYGAGVGDRFMWTAFGANSRAFPEPFLIIPVRQMYDKHLHGWAIVTASL